MKIDGKKEKTYKREIPWGLLLWLLFLVGSILLLVKSAKPFALAVLEGKYEATITSDGYVDSFKDTGFLSRNKTNRYIYEVVYENKNHEIVLGEYVTRNARCEAGNHVEVYSDDRNAKKNIKNFWLGFICMIWCIVATFVELKSRYFW